MSSVRPAYRHFLDLSDFTPQELRALLDAAQARKKRRRNPDTQKTLPQAQPDSDAPLSGHMLGLVFGQASTRTRVSFDVAMRQLGGEVMVLHRQDMQWERGESMPDTMKVLSRMLDIMMLRLPDHNHLHIFAANADIPIINGMTSFSHPCQVLADILTFEDHKGAIKGRKLAWLGAGNNMANSWVHAAGILGFELHLACPPSFGVNANIRRWAKLHADKTGAEILFHDSPAPAVDGAAALMTDCWLSMGDDPKTAAQRAEALKPFCVTADMMGKGDDPIFLHCLPAHRGEEVSDEVMAHPRAVIWDEAENRIHAQKAILLWCLHLLA